MDGTVSGESAGQRFFASTRGQVVNLLRSGFVTVDELARALGLTDNAVRAHLATLERDGLVRQSGLRRGPGSGKPAFAYQLTEQAEALFPKAYAEILRQLLLVLDDRLRTSDREDVTRALARRMVGDHQAGGPVAARVEQAGQFLGQLGGLATVQETEDGFAISGRSCPLAALIPGNPNACHLAEVLLEELVGLPVHEHCDRDHLPPSCRFDVTPK